MSSIKIVDINEEAKQEPTPELIEEAKEEVKEELMEEAKDEVIKEEQAMEENKENIKPSKEEEEDLKNNSKTERLKDKKITCPKCSKTMLLRSYRNVDHGSGTAPVSCSLECIKSTSDAT